MNILLDAMGGDNAPDANIKGALKAVNQIKATITLVGKEEVIRNKVKEFTGKEIEEVSEEDLKYLRDIAEQEAINRFTTAEINVDMSGMQNTVNSGDDIDGFMTKLTDSVNEAVDNMTEGVHE